MKTTRVVTLIGVLCLAAAAAHAARTIEIVSPTELRILVLDDLDSSNACASLCHSRFELRDLVDPGRQLPRVVKVEIDPDDKTVLRVTLNSALPDWKNLRFEARPLILASGKKIYAEFLFRLELSADPEQRQQLAYTSPEAFDPRSLPEVDLMIQIQEGNPFKRTARNQRTGQSDFVHIFELDKPLPRGKKLAVTVTEVGSGRAAKGVVQFAGYPETKKESRIYLKGESVFNALGDDTTGVEAKLELPEFARPGEWWDFGLKLEADMGSSSLGLSNTGSLALPFRRWFDHTGFLHSSSILISPIFRTDRDFENTQYGVDFAWEPRVDRWDCPKSRAEDQKSDKCPDGLSFILHPTVAFEVAWHGESAAEELVDQEIARARVGFTLALSKKSWTFALSADGRFLLEDEALLDGEELMEIDGGFKSYVTAEVSRAFGPVRLVLSHKRGRRPPGFSEVETTSLGLGLAL